MANFLRLRNQHFYLRLRVPSDLAGITSSPEILKSLKTKDRKAARLSAATLRSKLEEVFSLTRCGFITEQQAKEKLDVILQHRRKAREKTSSFSTAPRSITLHEIITQYTNDHKGAWTAKTSIEYASYFRLLADALEVENVVTINRDDVRKLRDTLCRLPSNMYKKYPNKTIDQVLELEDISPMSATTVNKLLTLFGSLMRHCIKEGYRPDNPADGLKVQVNRRADEERKSYSHDDLKKLVSALPSPATKPERHWVPLIGLYSGMRLGEICGLHLEDIKQFDGVWCFDVNEEGDKRLKTLASKRLVPIHPHLMEKGFLEFVEASKGKSRSVRLWPNLVRREVDGYCPALGNWFGRFNRKHITDDQLKSFHSLRHTFADILKQQGEQETLISELLGHTNGNISTGRYGKRYQPKVLLEAISKINYGLPQGTLVLNSAGTDFNLAE